MNRDQVATLVIALIVLSSSVILACVVGRTNGIAVNDDVLEVQPFEVVKDNGSFARGSAILSRDGSDYRVIFIIDLSREASEDWCFRLSSTDAKTDNVLSGYRDDPDAGCVYIHTGFMGVSVGPVDPVSEVPGPVYEGRGLLEVNCTILEEAVSKGLAEFRLSLKTGSVAKMAFDLEKWRRCRIRR